MTSPVADLPQFEADQLSNASQASGSRPRTPEVLPISTDLGFETLGREKISILSLSSSIETALERIRKARREGPKEGDSMQEIRVNHEAEQILLPKPLYNDDGNLLGLILIALAIELNYDLVLYETERYSYQEPTQEVRNFWTGFLLGITDKVNLKLDRKSKTIELGRACCHALVVRGHFRDHSKLTSAALRSNQLFFGNDPSVDSRTKVLKERMLIDGYLQDLLSDTKDCPSAKRAIVSLTEALSISKRLDDKTEFKAISDNLVTFEKLSDKFRRLPKGDTKPKKKDSKKATIGKLPERPTASPMITKEELDTISSFISPLWTNLASLQKGWAAEVQKVGFKQSKELINSTFKTRWDILEAISTITTKRLREMKSHEDDNKLTKRKVTKSGFEAWYTKRTDSKAKWLFELADITKPIRSLSQEQIKAMKIDASVLEKSRKLSAEADALRFSRAENLGSQVKPSLESHNAFEVLSEEADSLIKDLFKNTPETELRLVSIHDGDRSKDILFAKEQLFRLLHLANGAKAIELISIGELDEVKIRAELSRKKSGPNTPIGTIIDFLQKRGMIYYFKKSQYYGGSAPGTLGFVELQALSSIEDEEGDWN